MATFDNYDFVGWATKNDIRCTDGRTIRKDAFKHNDGEVVPMVWNHQHNDPTNVLGKCLLVNEPGGVRAYGMFNETENGQYAKMLVQHKDISGLSIFANQLSQQGGDVLHGDIKEVSLVLAGANPGAKITNIIKHGALEDEEAYIEYVDEEGLLLHSEISVDTEKEEPVIEHSDKKEEEDTKVADTETKERTIGDVIETMNEEQQNVLKYLIEQAANGAGDDDEDKGDGEMKHNAFDMSEGYIGTAETPTLSHSDLNEIFHDGKRYGSLKESFLAHAADYGIDNIELVYPDDTDYYDKPQFIDNQPRGWIGKVLSGVHHTPFSKVRMVFADITEDEARAKGYIKGQYKKEEVFKLLKRSVDATTVYKKQKFDRDDLVDADFDVVPWVKQEMNIKLDEELARAYIFGDGRSMSDEDKIKEDRIIPVISDEDLFTIKVDVTPKSGESLEHAIITASVLAQDDYQGSGNTIGFFEARQVSKMLLMEDQFGHRLYKNMSELASAMGVNEVVKVPKGIAPAGFYGVILDLSDYNVGQKAQGKKSLFDDFDINYNQQIYLMETRQSGALTRPYSAILLRAKNN